MTSSKLFLALLLLLSVLPQSFSFLLLEIPTSRHSSTFLQRHLSMKQQVGHLVGSHRRRKSTLGSKGSLVAEEEKEVIEVTDKNGKQLSVGDVVSVANELKAFQVPPDGRGQFDENKQFVPLSDDKDTGRASRHLLVPVGMKGVVTQLHTQSNLSANFKIQVKFSPGENFNEGGYNPPVEFVMHFASSEVEVCNL